MPAALPRFSQLLVALCGLAATAALAQTPAPLPRDGVPPPTAGTEQKIERIRHEDASTRIDELRVGGESKSITVQPKADVPEYEIQPSSFQRGRPADHREGMGAAGGLRLWNLLRF